MSIERTREAWERLGESDPLWAVLSRPGTRDGEWDVADFMATGRADVADVLVDLRALGVDFGRRALDFGCGVGRLTQALAGSVERVVGIDIAESMVRQARALNESGDRVEFVHGDGSTLPFPDDSFDSALTFLVLQHIPPVHSMPALLELHRVVRPGGVLVLQIPSHPLVPAPLPRDRCRARITVRDAPAVMVPATRGLVRVMVTNEGAGRWPTGHSLRLANHWRADGAVVVLDDGRVDLPVPVLPGESIEVELRVTAPEVPGDYQLELDVVQEFVAWWGDLGSPTAIRPVTVESAADGRPGAPLPLPEPPQPEPPQPEPPQPEPPQPEAFRPEPPLADAEQRAEVGGEPDPASEAGVRDSAIEMHPIPVTLVRSFFELLGCEVLASHEDTLAGPGWVSYTYIVRVG